MALCIDSYFRRLSLTLDDSALLATARRGRSPDQAGHAVSAAILVSNQLSQPRAFPKEAISEVIGGVVTRFATFSAVLLEGREPTLCNPKPIGDATRYRPSI